MRKHAEAFHTNKGWKLAILFFIPTLTFFKCYFHENKALHTPTFYMKGKVAVFSVFEVQFFQLVRY